ncbi:NAD-dependent epimerase/dehydratase family protein [Rhodococcus sp. HNM0569]|uniref:NAD-dependent epimerase/dehydratase family protein n=1 Tax=Rhodococcus sp. HNM0569 TaxID=2716340 RepID=UPI00146AE929|nr:NAD-dependent epimerase/dehydratase family protein [Rhodococcus sp. HNM0569]
MNTIDVVVGAGPIGSTVAQRLAEQGRTVRVLTRSGSGPEHPSIERTRVDATDPAAVTAALHDAGAVYHCMHASAYRSDVWERELPAAERVVLDAAGAAGAVVVFPESLYAYDASGGPITEETALVPPTAKGEVRAHLLAARDASATSTVSVVASDYFGPGATANAHAGERMIAPILAGRTVRPLGRADVPHSFTYLPDLADAMIRAAQDPALWNRVLFAPTVAPVTQADMVRAYAAAAGVDVPAVRPLPSAVLRAAGRVHRGTRELADMLYQFDRPFAMDSAASEAALGLAPTPLDVAARDTIAWWQTRTEP